MTVTIDDLRGRLLDADSHLQVPPERLDEALGSTFAGFLRKAFGGANGGQLPPGWVTPSTDPDAENVWTLKMGRAPGAFDAEKRIRALDYMGVDRQLLFPMAVPAAMMLSAHPEAPSVARNHNDFVLDWAAGTDSRLRPVSVINMVNVEAALAEAKRVIDRGAFAVNIGCGHPPAGLSPADEAWEPFWALCAEAGVPVLLHIGGEVGFTKKEWGDTPHLRPGKVAGNPLDGETVGPFSLSAMPLAPQSFLTALILDGVLERNPGLRIGVIEMTAQWVGPLGEMLDQRYDLFTRLHQWLPMRPSEYLARQVRVTPFWWEPVGKYIERYGLEDVYVFSTDFPHPEGGTDPIERFHASLAGHSDDVYEKFFVQNGALII